MVLMLTLLCLTACHKEDTANDDQQGEISPPSTSVTVDSEDENLDESKEQSKEQNEGEEQEKVKEEINDFPIPIEQDEVQSGIIHKDNPNFLSARQGQVDGIEFGIGSSTKTIIEEWGLPDLYDYYTGALFFRYDDKGVIFFTGAILATDGIRFIHDKVKEIGVFKEGQTIYNVKLGMTFAEITDVLGEPTYFFSPETKSDYVDELLIGNWSLMYDVGDYIVIFAAYEEDGPVHSLYLRPKVSES